MKTREQIYGNEAADLLRNIAMYKTLTEEQACRFYPGKGEAIKNLLAYLSRQRRIYRNPQNSRVSADATCDAKVDAGMLAAVWVLLDFIESVEYHSVGEYPVKICFFAGGELYEIIHVPQGQEVMMNHALAGSRDAPARRIIVVDNPEQIGAIHIPDVSGFCSVGAGGNAQYYTLE